MKLKSFFGLKFDSVARVRFHRISLFGGGSRPLMYSTEEICRKNWGFVTMLFNVQSRVYDTKFLTASSHSGHKTKNTSQYLNNKYLSYICLNRRTDIMATWQNYPSCILDLLAGYEKLVFLLSKLSSLVVVGDSGLYRHMFLYGDQVKPTFSRPQICVGVGDLCVEYVTGLHLNFVTLTLLRWARLFIQTFNCRHFRAASDRFCCLFYTEEPPPGKDWECVLIDQIVLLYVSGGFLRADRF